METHANHLHKAPSRGWKHYLFEFLMLFLAVFAGFLAENRREHYVEKERAKVFAVNLYEDLKKDTARLTEIIVEDKTVIRKFDSLCFFMSDENRSKTNPAILYYYGTYTPWVNFFDANNTTAEQLKNSGNLRIMDDSVSIAISEYDRMLNTLETEYRLSRGEFEKMEGLYFKIFDVYSRYRMMPARDSISRDSLLQLNFKLANDDPALIKEYIGWIKFESTIYGLHIKRNYTPLKIFATDLIALIRKKYDLK